MNPTQNLDMDAIRQALMRRMQGGAGLPASSQISQPAGQTPTGGSPVPAQVPTPAPGVPQAPAGTQLPKAKTGGGGVNFDDETKRVTKVLIQKLMQVL